MPSMMTATTSEQLLMISLYIEAVGCERVQNGMQGHSLEVYASSISPSSYSSADDEGLAGWTSGTEDFSLSLSLSDGITRAARVFMFFSLGGMTCFRMTLLGSFSILRLPAEVETDVRLPAMTSL
jgi:hypothetical protein